MFAASGSNSVTDVWTTTANAGNSAVRTTRWRYIRYADQFEERYEEGGDPYEGTNLASDQHSADIKAELVKSLPAKYVAPAPGRAHRTLSYSNEVACWEGKDIPPNAPIPGMEVD